MVHPWLGKLRDPVVGRDVLIGVALGVLLALIGGLLDAWLRRQGAWSPNMDNTQLMLGTRNTLGMLITGVSRSIRETLFFFFLIFLFRLLVRNQWAAGAAFALLIASANFFENLPVVNSIASFLILFGFAFVLLCAGGCWRWRSAPW